MNADLSYSKATRTNRWAAFRSEIYPATMTFDMCGGQHAVADPPASILPIPTIQSAPDWLTGISDGPDDLEDKLAALRAGFHARLRRRQFKCSVRRACLGSQQGLLRAVTQDYTSTVTGNLPATLFTSYSVTEFDAPPLLNGRLQRDRRLRVRRHAGGRGRHRPEQHLGRRRVRRRGLREGALRGLARFGAVQRQCRRARRAHRNRRARASARPTAARSQPSTISNDYTEALPSVNFTFNLAEDTLLRVGLARVIARPPLDELRASRSVVEHDAAADRQRRQSAARSVPRQPGSTCRSSGTSARSAGGDRGVLQGRRHPHRLHHANR